MSDIAELVKCSDRLTEFEALISDIPQADHRIGSLCTHEKELNRLWESVRACYDSIQLDSEANKKMLKEIKKKYVSSYTTYTRGISFVTEHLERLRADKIRDNTPIPVPVPVSSINLPPCKIKPFDGTYTMWPTFRDLFTAMYINRPISPVEKLLHLLGLVSEDVHKVISKCPLTNEGFELAWKNLVDTYENKKSLINAQMSILLSIPPISHETGPKIKELQRTINDVISNLELLKITPEMFYHVIFVYICSIKLPEHTLTLWQESVKSNSDTPKWEEMDTFLSARYQTLESVTDIRRSQLGQNKASSSFRTQPTKNQPSNSGNLNKSFNNSKKISTFVTKAKSTKAVSRCVLCQEQHPLRLCPTFLGQNVDERISTVKRLKCCSNCLAISHDFKTCRSFHVCFLCKQKHHSLLHKGKISNNMNSGNISHRNNSNTASENVRNSTVPAQNTTQSREDSDNVQSTSTGIRSHQTYTTHVNSNTNFTVLLGTAVCELRNNGLVSSARALIDPCSQASFITKRLQEKKLKSIPTFSVPLTEITGVEEGLTSTTSKMCWVTIGSAIDSNFNMRTLAYVVKKVTGRIPSSSLANAISNDFPDITIADINCTRMDLLLGGEVYPHILKSSVRKNSSGDLIAQETVFGWVLTGKVYDPEPLRSVSSYFNRIELNNQLARFWELEEVPSVSRLTETDEFCEQLYRSTTERSSDGRYVVSLPFKPEYPADMSLGQSRNNALSQFVKNEARLLKNPVLKSEYDDVISEYIALDHIREVQPPNSEESAYYMPHHAVIKPDSVTTKLRVVFNASNPSSNGLSLNNILYPGPILQADLTVLILRWRFYRFVFNADIEKMYRQILVHPNQTTFQRILFRRNPEEDIKDYELRTVTFGVNCAPYLAIRTLLQLASECEAHSPAASEILKNHMYVDDVLAGSHELEDGFRKRNELIAVLESAGFILRKWTANHIRLLEDLPDNHLLDADFLKLSDASTTKTLGLRWNAVKDSFYFKLVSHPGRNVVTKRAVLSEIAKLFDPAGWLSPKIIVAKMIMQQIWKDKTDWDECLNHSTLNQWHSFLDDYSEIEKIEIPRWVNHHPENDYEIHAFCDASEKAYAATVYVRSISSPSEITSHLLASKTKVAPVKYETLPRLELCGAVLMANMVESLATQLNLAKEKIYFWTDSTIVLTWLQKPPCHLPTFVANRVALIERKVGNENWSHVVSKDNPSDLASRGSLARDLIDNRLWWHGPKWLTEPKDKWPPKSFNVHSFHECVQSHEIPKKPTDILDRFSDLPRAMRVIAYLFRCLHFLRTRTRLHDSPEITHSEMRFVRDRLVLMCQQIYLPEYSILSKGLPLPPKSNLLALNPFIDSSGFLRMNGRLVHAPGLSYDEKYPKILPYSGAFTKLFVNYVHKCTVHGEQSLMLRVIRMEFWVPKLKNLVRGIIRNCTVCVLHRKKSGQQIMAALPPERTSLSRPFTNTGLDFAGPFDIKSYSSRGCRTTKGYVVVFVCFATKAIHLEVTGDMSSETFMAAFSRFFSRRGCPSHLYSDNGTAFVGASNLLEVSRIQFLSNLKQRLLSLDNMQIVQWHFIPPGAPHMGGIWEAGVKSFKTHLKKISNAQKFTYEEFYTMLTRIESCLNSRPLSPMSENPNDITPLTPGHFLIGAPLLAPPEPNKSDLSLSHANRWEKLKILHHQFALRWKEEYLKELHRRTKWKYPKRDFQEGDIVVVRQDNLSPNEWSLGRVEKVHDGPDEKIRVCDIRTASGTFTRPIVKLVLLPVSEQN